ncbi:MAG: hypothetical protein NTY19_06165 [Planctomycetota bacterium]|nr:hypothetical protein [Planctomycetota bacterium]
MNQDEIRFIQFPHPGGECRPGPDGKIEWNPSSEDHCRKFLHQKGRWVTGPDDSSPKEADLDFWAEWEPQSELIRRLPRGQPGSPKFLLRPRFFPKTCYQGLHNTDPFVFGDQFYYCVCKQEKTMRRLAPGSIIVFGSRLKRSFVLDTVFVVEAWEPHNADNYQTLPVPEVYRAAGLAPLYDGGDSCCTNAQGEPHRLYHGAMHDNRCHGMFSFFPCLPTSEFPAGFARPNICLPELISQGLPMGLKISHPLTADQANALWNRVAKQVREHQSLRLGVFAEIPSGGWTSAH